MTGEKAHVARYPLEGGSELIAVTDDPDGARPVIMAELRVARGFARTGSWPHHRVNLFIFETLQPLIDQLQRASRTLGETQATADAALHGLEGKPMVHAYNLADLGEASIFVNRKVMKRLGMWDDTDVIEGLLAHEHAHPLAENATTRAARNLKVDFTEASEAPAPHGIAQALHHLAHELCLHAPHEVFSNELAIRAGFGRELLALNRISLADGKAGLAARDSLAAHLNAEVAQGRLAGNAAALLLLMASLEAHARMALEVAAFTRAGNDADARALDELLWQEALSHVESEVGDIYRQLCTSYVALTADMGDAPVCGWAANTFAPVTATIARYGAHFSASFHY